MPLIVSNTSGLSAVEAVLCNEELKLDRLEFAQDNEDKELYRSKP
jgi:hypothetical protein